MDRRRFTPALVAAFLALAAAAEAQTLYKLVGKDGKVTYVDKVPKGFDGEVTPLTIDPATNAQGPARAQPPQAAEPGKKDYNTERRVARGKLQAALDKAAERLAAAKKALADGVDPREDEYQTIQQKFDASGAKPDQAGPRPNCRRQVDSNGKAIFVCPTIVPGEAYRDRQKALEDAVREAEAELAAAEQAYRRGTD
jgi:hypothetical protein